MYRKKNDKLEVLIFSKFYLPGYKAGGPIRTIANMVDRLGSEFDFKVVTLDRDSGDSEQYSSIKPYQWNSVGKASVNYIEKVSLKAVVNIITEINPNSVYLNSFFDTTFTQRVLLARFLKLIPDIPIILAPRGEFSDGALSLKPNKKKLYIFISKILGLHKNITWQASSELEKVDILKNHKGLKASDIKTAINLSPAITKQKLKTYKKSPQLKVCFLSRISPMKNLDFALKVLSKVKSKVVFDVYGPISDKNYWSDCQSLISLLPNNITVNYQGLISSEQVINTIAKSDLFFLPTKGENFGHVIHEALSGGVPVLISDRTPWNEINKLGIGWAISLDNLDSFVAAVEEVAKWDACKKQEVSLRSNSFAMLKAEDSAALNDNRNLFLDKL